jgi:hypothetical protein
MKRQIMLTMLGALLAGCERTNPVGPESPAVPDVSQTTTTYSGRATVISGTVLGVNRTFGDTGPLPSQGGALETSASRQSVAGALVIEVVHATTIGRNNLVRSEASVGGVLLTVGGISISADHVFAVAEAACINGSPALGATSQVSDLKINGQAIPVGTGANQVINFLGGQVIVNQQTTTANSITVTALHVIIPGFADLKIATAHADINCGAREICEFTGDFVTGGGWIRLPGGGKGTFGVAGGIKNGSLWGHLEYIDHDNGPKVHGTGVTAYTVTGPFSREIKGTADINGSPGTYRVRVTDNGEPGTNDVFDIWLSTGYARSNTLGGGNIQLHQQSGVCDGT